MEVQQKYLKKTGLIALIAVMNMVVPLSLDMYLPAVPQMTQVFNTSESVVNITLVGFFFFMAVGILLFGPLSDKYGRKPMLMAGTCIFYECCGYYLHNLWIYAYFLRKHCTDDFPFMLYTVYRNGKCRASLQHCDTFKSAGKGYGVCIGSYKFYTYCIG